jgi:type VI secretion system protein ImpJ
MRNLPVHWHEGQFLHPHHFQAADRYWTELIQTGQRWDHPYSYGIHQLRISEDALANLQFEVQSLQARMPDGTLVNLEGGQEPDRVDLKHDVLTAENAVADLTHAFEKSTAIRVYLAIPKTKMGLTNVTADIGSEQYRYIESNLAIQDESTGGNDQEVQFRRLNARILLSSQDLSGYDTLPIAQIRRSGEGTLVPRIDKEYIPPLIAIDAWNGLARDIIRSSYDLIGQKIEVLSDQVVNRGIGLDSRHPGDLDRILLLSKLNEAYSVLGTIAFVPGIHPLTAYLEMCRIVGQLSIFSVERRLTDIPPYNHDDLASIFPELKARILSLMNLVRDYEFEQRFFQGVGLGMQVALEPKWFNSDWQWYIGVRKGDLSEQECRDLLSPGQLDWKFGSGRQVEILFRNRAQGLEIRPITRSIRALPAQSDWLYFDVPRQDSPAWRDVQETQSLAMRLKDSLILNRDRLQGERELVVSVNGKRATLEFALFAVPEQQ